MEPGLSLPNRYAMILDIDTIRDVVAHAAQVKLSRRECHPLDHYNGRRVNSVLAKYDAEVDAAPAANEELDVIEAVLDTQEAPPAEPVDIADDDF